MRLGLTLSQPSSALQDAISVAASAEQAGFETVYVTERHFDATRGFANPFALAAAISACLQHAWVAVRPELGLQHPLRLVEQSNLLDVLTHGRSLIVLDAAADTAQSDAFGLPTSGAGLIDRMLEAWAWQYREEGPPLEFGEGSFSARLAGRVMPAACRRPHPLLALETESPETVVTAARRGWGIQLRGAQALNLVNIYRDALTRSGHADSTIEECLGWLVVALPISAETDLPAIRREAEQTGIAELRLDPTPDLALEAVLGGPL